MSVQRSLLRTGLAGQWKSFDDGRLNSGGKAIIPLGDGRDEAKSEAADGVKNLRLDPVQSESWIKTASWIIIGFMLFLVLQLKLVPALLGGLLVYELVQMLAPFIERPLHGKRARWLALVAISIFTVGLLVLLIFGVFAFFKSDAGNLQVFSEKLQHILTDARTKLPLWIVENLPGDVDDLKEMAVSRLRAHSKEVQLIGGHAMHLFVHMLIGMVIGALVSLYECPPRGRLGPLTAALIDRVSRFGDSFRRIVFAQVRISALNTVFTTFFLVVLLPLFGVQLPLMKILIATTFFCGLLPVVGNLLSNTVIVIVGLSMSIYVAVAALVFLVVIHKLEYFLNARIVGSSINSRAWELLLAMAVLEAAFGLAGLIVAPIYYAYIKRELEDAKLI
jgi:predicted PurR-regulated permease PerM